MLIYGPYLQEGQNLPQAGLEGRSAPVTFMLEALSNALRKQKDVRRAQPGLVIRAKEVDRDAVLLRLIQLLACSAKTTLKPV